DLNAKALVVERGSVSPAIEVAQKLGVRVIDLVANEAAGDFSLEPRDAATVAPAANGGSAQADDVALVLHTSGTTSRPKQVPLSHANLAASMAHIVAALRLGADDCALNA
ncbi:AMP-binding protein, partial [Salmonella enterica subsp. enterica serovar Typhimurium]|nr:AMP-binding protein [Salmonella enterica subsp. enterica serovar Typhimurium]